ncbi:MAG: hypothetical protein Q7W30_02545 [Coriobacteriia bacterium]|nr:hypothetical protein [Coriobacteriia bacterium]
MSESRDSLLREVVDLLWAQWTELGVGGTRGTSATIIDPEGLLAATTVFGRYEPRLFDEVLDWLSLHSDVLDVTRLRRVSAVHNLGEKRLLAAIVHFMREHSSNGKWSGTADRALAGEHAEPYAPQPLFRTGDGNALPYFGASDAFFAAQGFERPELVLRGLSTAPDPRRPALARLRARALTGQGARAEVLLYLSTHDHAHGRLISERAVFAQRQVAEYLTDMARAGLVDSWQDGRRVQYRLAPAVAGIGSGTARYVDWIGAYGVFVGLWAALSGAAQEPDAYRASTLLRSGLEQVRDELPVEGLDLGRPEPERHPGERLVDHAIGFVASAAERARALAG